MSILDKIVPPSLVVAELAGAFSVLYEIAPTLGLEKLGKVLTGVAKNQAAGEPWKELPPPDDRQETLSRRQIGSTVLLERQLRKVVEPEDARRITREIVLNGTMVFLKLSIPTLKMEKLLTMSDSDRKKFISKIQKRFFNADAEMEFQGDEALLMTVSRCRFVELLEKIGERDMASLFCEGDGCFFDKHQPEVRMERPCTLADGGACCDFRFYWT